MPLASVQRLKQVNLGKYILATHFEFDEGSEGEEEALVVIDTAAPVSAARVGRFLEALSREVQAKIEGDGYIVELVEFRKGSDIFGFKKRRRKETEREKREKRSLELQEEEAVVARKHRKTMTLLAALSLAMTSVPVGIAAADLMDEGEATTITIQQESCEAKIFSRTDFPYTAPNFGVPVEWKEKASATPDSPPELAIEAKIKMLADYDHGQRIEIAGRVMPRKSDFFRTARNTKLPILERPSGLKPGQLVKITAEVRKEAMDVGIVILQAENLDDP